MPGLLATLAALLLSVVSFSSTGIAAPDIGSSLNASAAEQSLVVSAYSLGFAVPLVLGGRLGDLFGRRRLMLLGMAGFTILSLVATFTTNVTVLITVRAITGVCAAAMVPQVLATITATTHGKERARAIGLFSATAGGATAVGQVLGGLLLSAPLFGDGWRTVFAASVVMGALAFLAGLRWVPDSNAPGHRSLDLIGTVLLGGGLIALMIPVSQGSALGWPVWCWVLLVAAPVLFVGFWTWQHRVHRRERAPLIPPPLFDLLSYRTGTIMALILQLGYGGFTFVFALTAQTGLGWSPLVTSLILLPYALFFFAVSIWAGKLALRFAARSLLMVGGIIQATLLVISAVVVYAQGDGLNAWVVAALLIGVGVGQAFMFGPLVGAMVADVPPKYAGAASGVLQTTQQASTGLGVAIAGGLLITVTSSPSGASAGSYVTALAVCLLVQAVIAVIFAVAALALPKR